MKIKKNMVCLGVIGCLFLGCVGCGTESAQETEAAKREASAETAETFKKEETALKMSEENVSDKEMKIIALETDAAFEYVSDGVSYLDELVADAILEQNEGHYADGECQAEGHIILEESEEDGISTVYALMMYGVYEFQNMDYFIKTAGTGVIPVVLKYDIRLDSGTPLVFFEWPADGSGYNESIKSMFPERLWDRVLSIQEADRKVLKEMEQGYAERYLEAMGRDAVIGEHADLEHTLLTDLGISVEVSNKLIVYEKTMGPYPYWQGTREKVEDGIRYIYSLFYEEESNRIIYEKCVFDSLETVEKFVYDAETGEPVRDE